MRLLRTVEQSSSKYRFLKTVKTAPYKAEIEYIEGDGTAVIDTNYTPTATTRMQIVWTYTKSGSTEYGLCGCYAISVTPNISFYVGESSSTNKLALGLGRGQISNDSSGTVSISNNKTYITVLDAKNAVVTNNGTAYESINSYPFDENIPEMHIWLFKVNGMDVNNNISKSRIHSVKIWENNVLTRDFIPVIDNNDVACLYERVTGALFYANTGTFTAGRKIIPVQYLSSVNSPAYINTGVYLSNNSAVEVDYQLSGNKQYGCCIYGTGYSSTFCTYTRKSTVGSSGYLQYNYGSQSDYLTNQDNDRHLIKQDKNLLYVDGSLYKTFNEQTFTLTQPAYLFFARLSASYTDYFNMQGKIYHAKFWDNDILVRDFIPAKDANGVGFMFDKVYHVCYTNANSSGNGFTCGEEIPSEGDKRIVRLIHI